MDLHIKISKINEDAHIPEYKTQGSSGMDLYSVDDVNIEAYKAALISTGLIIEIPDGYEGQVRPRSGMALKSQLTVLNSPGTIDSDYRGEIKIILFNANDKAIKINKGDRIAQLVIMPVIHAKFEVVDSCELTESKRGAGGFGSTGNK